MISLLAICAAVAIIAALAVHFLTRTHLAKAAEVKGVHLVCCFCGLTVARFVQLKDSRILCVNCKRSAEKQ